MANQDSMVAGKLAFMAPEQARGGKVDRRADIFSLGIVLYLLSTGRHPFGFGSPMETLQRIVRNAPVIPPCAADPNYPPTLERVVMRALAHEREDRFETAADMLYELSAACDLAHEMEVGAFVQDVCEQSLRARRAQISAALELAAARDEGAATPALMASVAPAPVVSMPPNPELNSLQHGSTNAPAATDLLFADAPQPKARGRRWALPAVLLGAALGVFAYQSRLTTMPVSGDAPSPAARALPVAPPAPREPPRPSASVPASVPAIPVERKDAAPTPTVAASALPPSPNKKTRRAGRCRPGMPCAPSKPATPVKVAPQAPKSESTSDHYGI